MHRKVLSLLTVLAVGVTVALFVILILFKDGVERGAEKGYGPFEVVIGAHGSESQLVLNTFYRIGAPLGNMPAEVWKELQQDKQAEAAYAITMGDYYNEHPIVGVEPGYFLTRYGDQQLENGELYAHLGEVTLGYDAARMLGIGVGDSFKGSHGLVAHEDYDTEHAAHENEHDHEHEAGSEEAHHDEAHAGEDLHHSFEYQVVGVLPKLNTPDDRAIFTTLEHAWAVHSLGEEERDVTAVIVKPSSLLALQELKHKYNEHDKVQAVYSSKAIADVMNLVDTGSQLLSVVMLVSVLLSALTLLLSLLAAIHVRRKDVGLLRLIGKRRSFIWMTLIGEGLLLTVLGVMMGLVLGHFGGWLLREPLVDYTGIHVAYGQLLQEELVMIAGAVIIGLAASAIPSLLTYRSTPIELFRS